MAQGVGRELMPVTKPDQFGQVHNAEKDKSGGNVPSAIEVNLAHSSSDVDTSPQSQHHTLGQSRNQASPGNHIHDGVTSPKLGPLEMDPSNPGKTRPALTLPVSPTANDVANLLANFVNFRRV